jgi:hypothetical protein
MASKKHAIRATVPAALKLTPSENTKLKDAFKTCVVDVLSASRPSYAAPFPEINISGSRRPKAVKKASSAKKGKKR